MDGFKFEIGEVVLVRSAVEDAIMAAKMETLRHPLVFMVTGRYFDECPGGVQRHYAISRDGKASRVHEIELLKMEEFDSESLVAEHRKIRKMITREAMGESEE